MKTSDIIQNVLKGIMQPKASKRLKGRTKMEDKENKEREEEMEEMEEPTMIKITVSEPIEMEEMEEPKKKPKKMSAIMKRLQERANK